MSSTSGKRLPPDVRRAQILEVACRLFAVKQFSDVWVDELAHDAAVSRGLLYHYFGGKQGLLRAVFERESERFNAATMPDSSLSPYSQLLDGLERYLTYVKRHPSGYRAIQQQALMSDPEIQQMRQRNVEVQVERMLTALDGLGVVADDESRAAVRAALTGWTALVTTTCLAWMESGAPAEESLVRIWVSAGLGALEGALGRPLPTDLLR